MPFLASSAPCCRSASGALPLSTIPAMTRDLISSEAASRAGFEWRWRSHGRSAPPATSQRWPVLGDRFLALPPSRGEAASIALRRVRCPVRQDIKQTVAAPLALRSEQIGLASPAGWRCPVLEACAAIRPGCGGSPAGRCLRTAAPPGRPSRTSNGRRSMYSRNKPPICSGSPPLQLAARSLPHQSSCRGELPGAGSAGAAAALGTTAGTRGRAHQAGSISR